MHTNARPKTRGEGHSVENLGYLLKLKLSFSVHVGRHVVDSESIEVAFPPQCYSLFGTRNTTPAWLINGFLVSLNHLATRGAASQTKQNIKEYTHCNRTTASHRLVAIGLASLSRALRVSHPQVVDLHTNLDTANRDLRTPRAVALSDLKQNKTLIQAVVGSATYVALLIRAIQALILVMALGLMMLELDLASVVRPKYDEPIWTLLSF